MTLVESRPLDPGARVVTDTAPDAEDHYRADAAVQLIEEFDDPCDLVLIAVPAGEGVAVEAAVRRFLGVEG